MPFTVTALADAIKAERPDNAITGFDRVVIDSREVRHGDCFFAIPGDNFNGHDYLHDAFANDAVCAVVSEDIAVPELADRCIIKVDDTIKALGDFAKVYRERLDSKVVAITGSVGKTTTRQIIHHVLSQHFRCCQAPKNFNNNIGLPLTLLAADPRDEIVAAEIGSSGPGEIAYLTQIAQPDIAVVTSVCCAHLSGLGSLEAIIEEKLSISVGLKPNGVLIVNGDLDVLVDACRARDLSFLTFGKSDHCDHQAHDVKSTGTGTIFTIDDSQVEMPLPGPGNVGNALAAWAVCSRFGLTVDDFARALKTMPPVSMRADLMEIGTLTVISDCYNANLTSMKNALDILADIASAKKCRSVFICGDMAELGPSSPQLHAELGRAAAEAKVELLLSIGSLAEITAGMAKECATHELTVECFEDTDSACNNLHEFIKDYDIILVKGSRAAGLEKAVEKLRAVFS